MSGGTATTTTAAESILQPEQQIRPRINQQAAAGLVKSLYGLEVRHMKELNSYVDKNYHVSVSPDHSNPHIQQLWPHGFVLKILNSMDSKKKHVDAEHQACQILSNKGFHCPTPVLTLDGQDKSLQRIFPDGADPEQENGDEDSYSLHNVRLLTFLPGKILADVPYTSRLFYQAGQYIANIRQTLKDFKHPALTHYWTMWNLAQVPKLCDFLHVVKDPVDRALIAEVLEIFPREVLANVHKFTKGAIHGDFNEQNVIVESVDVDANSNIESAFRISGLIDFGDMQDTYYVFEVAVTIMHIMVGSKLVEPMDVGGHVLAGYLGQAELNPDEFDALKVCVAGRYAQTLVLGAYTLLQDPGNEYVVGNAKNGWRQLRQLWGTSKEEIYAKWRSIIESYKAN